MAWANVRQFSPEGIGRVAVIVGVIVICYQRLVLRTAASEDMYQIGFDIGFEAGHTEGHKQARPVVVELASRRCRCQTGKSEVLTSAGSVVDRG